MATSERRGSMSGKFEEIMAASKLSELLQKKDEDHTKKVIVWVLAIIGAVAAVAAIAYAVYSSLHRIIWKTLKKILTMTLMTTSSMMKMK